MPLPSLKDHFAALIATPSVSCTQDSLDQSNGPVIELLAAWLGDLGFSCEIQTVEPGKFNLLASYGSGPGGLVLAGHSDTVPFDAALWQTDPALSATLADSCHLRRRMLDVRCPRPGRCRSAPGASRGDR